MAASLSSGAGWAAGSTDISRVTVRERRLEKVTDLGGIQPTAPVGWPYWMTLDPQDAPVILGGASTYDLYVLDREP